MHVLVNGTEHAVDEGCTVAVLLERLRAEAGPCAVEVNRTLVPRAAHAETVLAPGDEIEIVTLVGGG